MALDFLRKAIGQSVGKLRTGLTRTRNALVGSPQSLLRGWQLDQQLLDELCWRLILADLGVAAKTLGFANRFGRGIALAQSLLRKNGSPPLRYIVGENHLAMIVEKRS